MALKYSEEKGSAWGGIVHEVKIGDSDDFYRENVESFSQSGRRTFLSAMGIPPSFFMARNVALQDNMLTDVKQIVAESKKSESIYVLDQNGVLQYSAVATSLGWEGPDNTLGMDTGQWVPRFQSVSTGMVSYVRAGDKVGVNRNDYFTTAFMKVPIFLVKPVSFEIGMFKLLCTNGAVDVINAKGFSLKPKDFSKEIFQAFMGGLSGAIDRICVNHSTFVNLLREEKTSIPEARQLLHSMSDPESGRSLVPKAVLKETLRHLDLTEKGKAVPPQAPTIIDTQYDLFDAMTYYARGSATATDRNISMQQRAESRVFSLFYSRFLKDGKIIPEKINLKTFGPKTKRGRKSSAEVEAEAKEEAADAITATEGTPALS